MKRKQVVLVGPSPHLEGMGLGSNIDQVRCVARMNNSFEISNHEDYGYRTDLIFLNKHWQTNNENKIEELQKRYGVENIYLKHKNLNKIKRTPKGYKHTSKSPNMGVLAITALHNLGFKDIFVTGFSFYQNHPFYMKEHYENQEGMILEGESHPQIDTVKDVQQLIKLGIVTLWPDTKHYHNIAKQRYNI